MVKRTERARFLDTDRSNDRPGVHKVQVNSQTVKLQADRRFTDAIPAGVTQVAAHARVAGDVVATGPWVEQYHINPLLPVMVDHSDLSRGYHDALTWQ